MSFSMKLLYLRPVAQVILTVFLLLYLYSMHLIPLYRTHSELKNPLLLSQPHCNLFRGRWVRDLNRKAMYDGTCPFHRNAWNCIRNKRENMEMINSWTWIPHSCHLPPLDPLNFMEMVRDRRIGFVGDSLNENFLVAFLCLLRVADPDAVKWKRRGAWRGGYFPRFNVTVAYHRAVLLSRYRWQPKQQGDGGKGSKGSYRVDVDRPADEWVNITDFYDVLVFNTGHWWNHDKFPEETPLVFYRNGLPLHPPLEIEQGLRVVLENTVSYIQTKCPKKTLKLWRLQSPMHFHGGDWNHNGTCLFTHPLHHTQLESWFDHGVDGDARKVNRLIEGVLGGGGTGIRVVDLTRLSEFRADAHPAAWLGKKDAVSAWGQDCTHWCLPGVPDTWVDILSQLILSHFSSPNSHLSKCEDC